MNDILQNKTVIYRGAAKLPGRPAAAFCCVLVIALCCALVFNLASALPYGVVFKVAALALAALGINYVLKKGTFSVTYALTNDGTLVYITKYGLLSWESAWISVAGADFKGNKIFFEGRKYDFFPDDTLMRHLGLK